ncbi:MAG TPA: deaminase [Acidimicrobiales bacterium]|nr:deaminase [Acidimicrobiales bacterium]
MDAGTTALLERAAALVAERLRAPRRTAVEDVFLQLVVPAVSAAEAGNYGVAAALLVTEGDRELTVVARNSMLTDGDPCAHAETNVLAGFRMGPSRSRDVGFAMRTRSNGAPPGPATLLCTTVEPCPMCTVAILNAGIDQVVWAVADDGGGAFDESRAERLPPVFVQARSRMKAGPVSTDPASELFVAGSVVDILGEAFRTGRDELDARLVDTGVLDVGRGWERAVSALDMGGRSP